MNELTSRSPQRDKVGALNGVLIAFCALLIAISGVNLYLLLRGWFVLPAVGAIGAALMALGVYALRRTGAQRYVWLMVVVGGAAMICTALTANYWAAAGTESIPVVCDVRSHDGSAIASAKCQVLVATSGEPVGEGITDDSGFARFRSLMNVGTRFSWLQTRSNLDVAYDVRVSAPGFKTRDEPLAQKGHTVGTKGYAASLVLEPSE